MPLFSPLANVCIMSPWAPIGCSTWCIHPWMEATDGSPRANCSVIHAYTQGVYYSVWYNLSVSTGAFPVWSNCSSKAGTWQTALPHAIKKSLSSWDKSLSFSWTRPLALHDGFKIGYLSCRQVLWCRRLSYLPRWYWFKRSINNNVLAYLAYS